ncbi:MAG: low temperature requirement protein A [Pseudonocardiaceae bacterium]
MRRVRVEVGGERASVTPLELFFDLVFVFALTQVTALMAQESAVTVTAVARGTLILAVLWWCWVCYAWLFNVIRADEGVARAAMFGAMGSMFVAAITIPEAFDDLPGGLPGPTVFAVCYFVVRAIHILMFWLASRDDPTLRGQVIRFVPPMLAGTLLLLIAAQTTGTTQTLLWLAALAGDYLGTLVAGTNWRLNSAAHFAERHGLIIIVALGESIVSLGIGVAHLPVSWTIIVASGLGLAVTGALWWAYFDITSRITERALTAAQGPRQIMLARNGYSYLHLPMIIGIIMLALGLKKVLSYVAGDGGHTLPDPISGVPLAALYGGTALYLLAHVGFKVCLTGSVSRVRLTVVVLLVTLTPLIAGLPALATLAVLATVLVALIAYETMRYAVQRHEIRHDTAHGHARNDD